MKNSSRITTADVSGLKLGASVLARAGDNSVEVTGIVTKMDKYWFWLLGSHGRTMVAASTFAKYGEVLK